MPVTGPQKCAVLLCKFTNSVNNPANDPAFFWDMFTHRGGQSMNDYFIDISNNIINLDGTQIFGWRTIPMTDAEYIAANPNRYNRIHGVLPYFFPQVDPSKFAMIITIFNGDVKDGGTWGGVLVNFDSINGTFLGHEMGHNFGLNHSYDTSDRKDADWSGPGEYFDSYDIMSAMNVYGVPHERYGSVGPRLCALYVDQQGWMPDAKKFHFNSGGGSSPVTIDIKSMSHAEQPGYQMVYLDDNYTIEFRTKEGWDASIPDTTILIHSKRNGLAYLEMSNPSTFDHAWSEGATWTNANPFMAVTGGIEYRVHVDKYFTDIFTARVTILGIVHPRKRILDGLVGQIIGGVAVDGNGGIIVNGVYHPVPPRGPEYEILKNLSELASLHEQDIKKEIANRIDKLENIEKAAEKEIKQLRSQQK